MTKRQSNNPKRRVAPPGELDLLEVERLVAETRYVGSALHKQYPGNYGFHPPVNPRPHKSLCDDVRSIPLEEARRLFESGIRRGMVSTCRQGDLPKYIWCVDDNGEVYEAKIGIDGYHGYRLNDENESAMRKIIVREWNAR